MLQIFLNFVVILIFNRSLQIKFIQLIKNSQKFDMIL